MSFFGNNRLSSLPSGNGGEEKARERFQSPFARANALEGAGERDALSHITERVQEHVIGARLLTNDDAKDAEVVMEQASRIIEEYALSAASQDLPILTEEHDAVARAVVNAILGWGPITFLMNDPSVEEIVIIEAHRVWFIRAGGGGWQWEAITPLALEYWRNLINRKADWRGTGRALTPANPTLDAQLPDGSRLHAAMTPVVRSDFGISITIRRFRPVAASLDDLVGLGSMPVETAKFIKASMRAGLNMAIVGGTSSGKTTFINACLAEVPPTERVITCEDTAELQVPVPNKVGLLTREEREGGARGYTMANLVKETLRMRPDRIIIGEVRDGAMASVLQAANTGHEGIMFTVHADSVFTAIERMETMTLMDRDSSTIPTSQIRKMISSAMNLVVNLKAIHPPDDGPTRRRVAAIAEIRGTQGIGEGLQVTMEELFRYDDDADGAVWTGTYPSQGTMDRLRRRGGYDFKQHFILQGGSSGPTKSRFG